MVWDMSEYPRNRIGIVAIVRRGVGHVGHVGHVGYVGYVGHVGHARYARYVRYVIQAGSGGYNCLGGALCGRGRVSRLDGNVN